MQKIFVIREVEVFKSGHEAGTTMLNAPRTYNKPTAFLAGKNDSVLRLLWMKAFPNTIVTPWPKSEDTWSGCWEILLRTLTKSLPTLRSRSIKYHAWWDVYKVNNQGILLGQRQGYATDLH